MTQGSGCISEGMRRRGGLDLPSRLLQGMAAASINDAFRQTTN